MCVRVCCVYVCMGAESHLKELKTQEKYIFESNSVNPKSIK